MFSNRLSKPSAGTALLALGCAFLSGCAANTGRYPSLSIRDAERAVGQFTPAAPDNPPEPAGADGDPARIDSTRVDRALETARIANARFGDSQPGTANLIEAAGAAPGDEDLQSRALVSLAALSSLRSQTARALADLDQLDADAAGSFAARETITDAQMQIAGLVQQQDAVLDLLGAQMP